MPDASRQGSESHKEEHEQSAHHGDSKLAATEREGPPIGGSSHLEMGGGHVRVFRSSTVEGIASGTERHRHDSPGTEAFAH